MENNDLGNIILDIVDDALNSMNFDRLNNDISKSVQSVFDELNIKTTKVNTNYRKKGMQRPTTTKEMQPAAKKNAQKAMRNPPGDLAGIVLTALGATFTSIFGLSIFVSTVLGIAIDSFATAGTVTSVILIPFLIASIAALVAGVKMHGRAKRFKQYMKIIGSKTYCRIRDLAKGTKKTEPYVLKDLEKMIDKHFFEDAHLDSSGQNLILDSATYQQYLDSENAYRKRLAEEKELRESAGEDTELAKALREGQDYIRRIQEANDAIPGEAFTAKLDQMEDIITKIFEVVRQKPEQLYKLRRFMKYYMPTTIKLLEAYKELDAQPVQGENILRSKEEIENTLDTINIAYEKLLDSFFEESAMEIKSDISVLQNMFAQEGLGTDPFAGATAEMKQEDEKYE